jgi:hypothetical protein
MRALPTAAACLNMGVQLLQQTGSSQQAQPAAFNTRCISNARGAPEHPSGKLNHTISGFLSTACCKQICSSHAFSCINGRQSKSLEVASHFCIAKQHPKSPGTIVCAWSMGFGGKVAFKQAHKKKGMMQVSLQHTSCR